MPLNFKTCKTPRVSIGVFNSVQPNHVVYDKALHEKRASSLKKCDWARQWALTGQRKRSFPHGFKHKRKSLPHLPTTAFMNGRDDGTEEGL